MRLKLITKYTIVTSIVLLVTMALFAITNMSALKRTFLQEAVTNVDNLSETLIRTTHYQMLEDDRKRVYQMIQEVGTQKGIEHIRLINKEGAIIFSTERSEIGSQLDKNAEACNMCHAEEIPLTHASTMSRSRLFQNRRGEDVLGMAKGVYGVKGCYTAECHVHQENAQILGVLDVIVSLDEMNARVATYRNNVIILTFVLLLLVFLCLTLLTQKMVNQPVHRLLRHVREMARGNLRAQVERIPDDELGELASAFNDMAKTLDYTQEELIRSAQTLEARVEERTTENLAMQARLLRSEKLASLGELVAGIAHEINNPLTSVLMYASICLEDSRLPMALRGDMSTVLSETQRCAEIVRGLLDFSRESVAQKRPESVNRILDKTLTLVQSQAIFHNIQLVREFTEELPAVCLDPGKMEQVFMNLVMNAIQAMEGGGVLTVGTGFALREERVFVRVSDSGCGIPEENLEKIFDPFYTTKDHCGTGLGLSVSYGIVESHGGQIEVESRVGAGASFTVKLPAVLEKGNAVAGKEPTTGGPSPVLTS